MLINVSTHPSSHADLARLASILNPQDIPLLEELHKAEQQVNGYGLSDYILIDQVQTKSIE
jgi:hypothetical protein